MPGISDLFNDPGIISKIQHKLPYLFAIAEAEASRGGKLGMEIGSVRERIIIALLRYYFGRDNVSDDIPITEPETDVILHGRPISIKTKTGAGFAGIKSVWTVDWEKIDMFIGSYAPKADMIMVRIVWGTSDGGFYHIPITVQNRVFAKLGTDKYMKKPSRGTNPRGVEYSAEALRMMVSDQSTHKITIDWKRNAQRIDVYEKWEKYWRDD